jgi:hypothetical protein
MRVLIIKTVHLIAAIAIIGSMSLTMLSNNEAIAQSTGTCDESLTIVVNNNSVVQNTGVDFKIKNSDTGWFKTRTFDSMPPPSFDTCWTFSQFPIPSDYQICAWYHDSGQLIKCKDYTHSRAEAQVTFNLDPSVS